MEFMLSVITRIMCIMCVIVCRAKKHSFLKFNPYLELVNVTDITECLKNEP